MLLVYFNWMLFSAGSLGCLNSFQLHGGWCSARDSRDGSNKPFLYYLPFKLSFVQPWPEIGSELDMIVFTKLQLRITDDKTKTVGQVSSLSLEDVRGNSIKHNWIPPKRRNGKSELMPAKMSAWQRNKGPDCVWSKDCWQGGCKVGWEGTLSGRWRSNWISKFLGRTLNINEVATWEQCTLACGDRIGCAVLYDLQGVCVRW